MKKGGKNVNGRVAALKPYPFTLVLDLSDL